MELNKLLKGSKSNNNDVENLYKTYSKSKKGITQLNRGLQADRPVYGKRGKKGKTPKRGKDYFTPKDVINIIHLATPKKGQDYFDGKNGEQGPIGPMGPKPEKGKDYLTEPEIEALKFELTPKKGVDYFTKEELKLIKEAVTPRKGKDYFDGKSADISPIYIREALESLKGDNRLDSSAIKNIDKLFHSLIGGYMRAIGSGSSTFLALTDTPNAYGTFAGYGVRVNATEDGLEFYLPIDTDEKVKASAGDPVAGFLDAKVDNITIEVVSNLLQVKGGVFESVIAPGTTAQYWRGDKTWQTLDTSVVPENGNLYFTNERVDDRVAGLLVAGTGISLNYDDPTNTLTITSTISQYTDEQAQDAVFNVISAGDGIFVNYNDPGNVFSISNTGVLSITGTANQVIVDQPAGDVTLSLPQNIHTGANPTFAGITLSSFTIGSVLFAGASGLITQDNANLYYDNTRNYFGVGTNLPEATVQIIGGNGITDPVLSVFGGNYGSSDGEIPGQEIYLVGGRGSDAISVATPGGAGGNVIVSGGPGGNPGVGESGGAGGNVYIYGGNPGTDGGTGNVLLAVNLASSPQGNVGVGTSSPGVRLEVSGSGRFSSTLIASNGFTQSTGPISVTATSGIVNLTLSSNGTTGGFRAVNSSSTSGNQTVGYFVGTKSVANIDTYNVVQIDANHTAASGTQQGINNMFINATTSGGGTINFLSGFTFFSSIGTGTTVGQYRMAHFANPTVNGTLTTLYAIKVDNLTSGTNKYVFYSEGGGLFLHNDLATSTADFQVRGQATQYTLYVDVSTNSTGFGTNTPASRVDVASVAGGILTISRRDTTVTSGESIGVLQWYTDDSTLTTQNIAANIEVVAAQDFTTNAAASDMIFRTTGTTAGGSPTERFRITNDGRLYGSALHNNSGSVTGTTNQYIASGTYTPTLSNVTNIAASTAYACQWTRVGNVVTVSGKVDIDTTLAANTASELGISLPIASSFTAEQHLGGIAASDAVASEVARIRADATNDRASVVFKSISLSNDSYSFIFKYVIL